MGDSSVGQLLDPPVLAIIAVGAFALVLSTLAAAASAVDRHARMTELRIDVVRLRRSRQRPS